MNSVAEDLKNPNLAARIFGLIGLWHKRGLLCCPVSLQTPGNAGSEGMVCLTCKEPVHSTHTGIGNGRDRLAGESLGKSLSLSELVSFTVTAGQSGRSCAKEG